MRIDGAIVSIVMLFLYLSVIVPIGFAVKLMRKDLLRLGFNPNLRTYWIERSELKDSTSIKLKEASDNIE